MKTGIGRLSAYCGAVCAGCAAGAAIAWLNGGDTDVVSATLVNSLGTVSGMVCDGAKASCAAKIATSVWAGLLGWDMSRSRQRLEGGDGIVGDDVEETIRNVGRLGRVGMRETDRTILRIMTDQPDPA
jgi:L-cysteine desulfidase